MDQKILVVYYSLTGNNKYIAEIIKEKVNADILELKPTKELNPKGAMKFLWGGFQATMHKKPELEPINLDPLSYDIIFIGTPVWAWTISPPVRTFLSKYDFSGKNVALWISSGGGPGKTLNRFCDTLKDSNILGKIAFVDPLKNSPEEAKQKTIEWVTNLISENN